MLVNGRQFELKNGRNKPLTNHFFLFTQFNTRAKKNLGSGHSVHSPGLVLRNGDFAIILNSLSDLTIIAINLNFPAIDS